MPKWLKSAGRLVHVVVPYLALALTLGGQPECAAALQAVAGGLNPAASLNLAP